MSLNAKTGRRVVRMPNAIRRYLHEGCEGVPRGMVNIYPTEADAQDAALLLGELGQLDRAAGLGRRPDLDAMDGCAVLS